MKYRIDGKQLCFVPYPTEPMTKYDFVIDGLMWEEMTKVERAKAALGALRLSDVEHNALIAVWVDKGCIKAEDAEGLTRVAKQVTEAEIAEDADALAEVMDIGFEAATPKKKRTKKAQAAEVAE